MTTEKTPKAAPPVRAKVEPKAVDPKAADPKAAASKGKGRADDTEPAVASEGDDDDRGTSEGAARIYSAL